MQTEELDPKKIKLWNWYNKERQKQYGIIRPQTGWEKFLGFAGKIAEPETYLEPLEKGWEQLTKPREEEFRKIDPSRPFYGLIPTLTGEDVEKTSVAPQWEAIQQKIKSGSPLEEDELKFVDRYLEGHVTRPPGFTAEQWLKQPEALQKGYNYAVLGTILVMPLASVISHPTFGPRVKFALNKLYHGKPPKFTKLVTKGYTLEGKPETEVRWQAVKPGSGAASITREVTAELHAIKPAILKTVKTLQFKDTVHKQLYDLVSKYKPNPTSVDMEPFYKTADALTGTPLKGLINPAYGEVTYNQINKVLPFMLNQLVTSGKAAAQIKEVIPEEEIVDREIGRKLTPTPEEYAAPEVAPRAEIPLKAVQSELQGMLAEVQRGEPGKRIKTDGDWVSQPSTYPKWMGEHHLTKKQVVDAFEKETGGVWTELQVIARERVEYGYETPEYGRIPSYMEQETEMFSGIPLPKSARDYLHRMTEPVRGIPLTTDKVFIQWNADSNEAVMQGKVLGDEWKRKVKEANLSSKDIELIDKYMELPAEYAEEITAEQKVIADWQGQIYGKYHEIASEANLLDEFIENYVPHLYKDSPEKVRKILFPLISRRSLATRPFFTRKRTIPTADEAEKLGLHPIRDGGIKLQVYTNALFKTLANKKLIDVFQNMNDKEGRPLIMRSDKAPRDYKIIRHRAFDRFMWVGEEKVKDEKQTYLIKVPYSAHPELADSINNLVDPSIPYNKWMRYLVGAQGIVKRLVMYNPLIHGWNIYSDVLDEVDFNAVKAFNIVFRGQVPDKLLKQFEFNSLDELDLDSVKHGLSSDAVFGATNELYANMQKLEGTQVSKWLLPLIKVRDLNDKILWQRMVLSSQRSIYLNKLSQLVKENPKVSVDELKWQASHFTNDLLGTLPSIIFTKNEALTTRLLLFARNWTISNLRLLTGSLGEYGTSKLMPGPLRHKGLTKEEANRIAPHYRRHLIKGMMALVLGVAIVNSGIKSVKEGKPTAWWPWEAEKGHWLDIDTQTRDKKGRKIHVKPPLFRYMSDYIGYGTAPMQTIYNKAEPVLKQGAEQFMNYSKWRRGPITEAEGVLALKERFDYALGGLTPFGTLYGVTEEKKTPLEKYIPLSGTWIRRGVSPELYQRLGWLSKDDRKKFEGTLSQEEKIQLRRTERRQKYGRTLSETELDAASKLAQKYFDWSKKRRLELRELDNRINDLILSGKLYEAKRLMREEDRYKLPDRERKMRERINRVLGGTGAR